MSHDLDVDDQFMAADAAGPDQFGPQPKKKRLRKKHVLKRQ